MPDLQNTLERTRQKTRLFHLLRTGEEPIPVEEEVEVIAVLEAGKRSLIEGREVTIAEVLT